MSARGDRHVSLCGMKLVGLHTSLRALFGLVWVHNHFSSVAYRADCCINSTSGLAFEESCVCLLDNSQVSGRGLVRGQSSLYHWVLDPSSTELITEVPRGNLTFRLSPCSGSARMEIKSSSPSSWPFLPTYSSEDDFNPAALTISVQANEYAVFVTAGNLTSSSSFDLATYNTLSDAPHPGGDGVLSATMPTSNSAAISISASETRGAGNLSYRLYWSNLSTWTGAEDEGEVPSGCVFPTDGVTLLENPNCLFSSACGMYRASEGMSDWVTLPNDTDEYSFEAPVSRGVQYIFNVAMRDSNNITSAYRASNMTFTFTDYQQCVADQGCQSQVHDDFTIIAVCSCAVVLLVLLVGTTMCLRRSMKRTMITAVRNNAIHSRGFKQALKGVLLSPPPPSMFADTDEGTPPMEISHGDNGRSSSRVHRIPAGSLTHFGEGSTIGGDGDADGTSSNDDHQAPTIRHQPSRERRWSSRNAVNNTEEHEQTGKEDERGNATPSRSLDKRRMNRNALEDMQKTKKNTLTPTRSHKRRAMLAKENNGSV